LDEHNSELEDFLNRLGTNVSLLEKCNKGYAKANEEKEYVRATVDKTDLMFTANKVISRVKARGTLIPTS